MRSPFSDDFQNSVARWSEAVLIKKISKWLGSVSPPTPQGIGDDCAVLECSEIQKHILTTDALCYRQHFDDSITPEAAGAKLIKRNLSDIAAMGGTPGSALLALLMGTDVSIRWLEGFFTGIRNVCQEYEILLVGGDTSRLSPGNFSAVLTLIGSTASPKLRQTAHPGDYIYVTGTLGGSILQKHFDFKPRLKEGRWLANQAELTAMMDLTDGLGKDLQALLPKNCSAAILQDCIPISKAAGQISQNSGRTVLEHAFCDGEDYELLFTVSGKSNCHAFEKRWSVAFPALPMTQIGQFIPANDKAALVDAATNEALPWPYGFDHLKSK